MSEWVRLRIRNDWGTYYYALPDCPDPMASAREQHVRWLGGDIRTDAGRVVKARRTSIHRHYHVFDHGAVRGYDVSSELDAACPESADEVVSTFGVDVAVPLDAVDVRRSDLSGPGVGNPLDMRKLRRRATWNQAAESFDAFLEACGYEVEVVGDDVEP